MLLDSAARFFTTIPCFYFAEAYRARQLNEEIPDARESFKRGLSCAPTINMSFFIDQIADNIIKNFGIDQIVDNIIKKEGVINNFYLELSVEILKAPICILTQSVRNGQCLGLTIKETFKKFSAKQAIVIFCNQILLEKFSGYLISKYIFKGKNSLHSIYMTNFCLSILTYPGKTVLTHWQKGKSVTDYTQLMRGVSWNLLQEAFYITCFLTIRKFLFLVHK